MNAVLLLLIFVTLFLFLSSSFDSPILLSYKLVWNIPSRLDKPSISEWYLSIPVYTCVKYRSTSTVPLP